MSIPPERVLDDPSLPFHDCVPNPHSMAAPPRAAAAAKQVEPHILFQTQNYGYKTAIVTHSSRFTSNAHLSFTDCTRLRYTSYHQLQWGAHRIARYLGNLKQKRIAVQAVPDESFIKALWGIWAAGGIAVPVHGWQSRSELEYILQDAQVRYLLDDHLYDFLYSPVSVGDAAEALSIPTIGLLQDNPDYGDWDDDGALAWPEWNPLHLKASRGALILYTSGTTGQPKGVLMTHGNLHQQIQDIVQAWKFCSKDKLLHFLPLHDTHGILVNLLSPLWAGANLYMLPRADPKEIWTHYADQHQQGEGEDPFTMMMAVPTIYMKLLEAFDKLPPEEGQAALRGMQDLRVTISGSEACPLPILKRWEELTGHRLLECYGMTELGMALTNPLKGDRVPGYVGQTFPSIRTRLVDPTTQEEGTTGELRLKGPGIFKKYWNRPQETAQAFDDEGWFKTGDIAEYNPDLESFRILRRASVDIINSGGYKISALEIEAAILEHEAVAECAVVGIQDVTGRELIVAILRLRNNHDDDDLEDIQCHMRQRLASYKFLWKSRQTWKELIVAIIRLLDATDDDDLEDIQRQTRQRLASYKVPRIWMPLPEIPKNAMGKVYKTLLRDLVQLVVSYRGKVVE